MAANGTTGGQPAWKREVNDKLAAARARRQAGLQAAKGEGLRGEVLPPGQPESRVSRVAAAVAARYAQAPSYSEYLAAEVQAAVAAAEQAQQSAARAVAEAEQARAMVAQLTAPSSIVPELRRDTPSSEQTVPAPRKQRMPDSSNPPVATVDYAASGIPARPVQAHASHTNEHRSYQAPPVADPLAEALITPSVPLPAKLLEFPRELIAARKARPRLAEGPLRDEPGDQTQLRIFEVEPEAISTAVEPVPAATEWSSIRLDAYPAPYAPGHPTEEASQSSADTLSSRHSQSPYHPSGASPRNGSERAHPDSPHDSRHARDREAVLVRVASLEDRMMAALVDGALVGIAFLLFAFVFTASTVHPPAGRPAFIGSAIVLVGFYLLYLYLFFSFSSGTPGMLYARIALCTFDDDNPTREAMRKRIFALVLAAMPLGLGFLYAIFDEDHLGWHDRMTRMYQRSYK